MQDKESMKKKTKKTATSTKTKAEKTLVIVESPAKAKTIERYLGSSYTVKASMGHLIDLPKSRIAVDVEHDFEPEYITVRGRGALLNELRAEAQRAQLILLASDNDREGEAIAWHLQKALRDKAVHAPIARIVFNEITPTAIKKAVEQPRDIDESKVNAQKARRVLDRLVGYNLSPILWKKVKNGLSAGRVQSVALRLICEREAEVESFVPEEYWTLEGDFKTGKSLWTAQLILWNGEKPDLKNVLDAEAIIEKIAQCDGTVKEVVTVERTVKPKAPFTTSQLQQTAANRLNFNGKKTMQIAQQLYEGIDIGSGRSGLITYIRTDSVRVAAQACTEARSWINEHYPEALPETVQEYAVGAKAQDAHEAIRPTYPHYTPDFLKQYLTYDQWRMYALIWERFIAGQMKAARVQTITIDITVGEAVFRISGKKIIEKGFYAVLNLLLFKEKMNNYPHVKKGDCIHFEKFHPELHVTQGPARYTDASIVKALEEKGIGRPSTYAPIISVLLERFYITRISKQLNPTVLGRLINTMLVEYFPHVVDVDFTARMESRLDAIAEKQMQWTAMLHEFYGNFKQLVDEVSKSLESYKGSLDEPTDKICEKCGRPMLKRLGRFGYFIACSGFPECRNSKPLPVGICPKCGGDIVAKKMKGNRKTFYGCTNYPACDYVSYTKPPSIDSLHSLNTKQD
ncbi:putative DNA topoisomerase I [Pillotina sp. SPG140]|jgi:DNA topoisomerase-1